MVVSGVTVATLVAALAGGLLGAAVGALPALGLAGLVIVVGEVAEILFLDASAAGILAIVGVDGAPLGSLGPITAVGFGPLLGPHVAFAGGVGAAAYAGRKETIDTGFRYHQAKQIGKPLLRSPRYLLVGAVFGLAGLFLAWAGRVAPVDPIALAVVLSALLGRLAFGYPLIGRFRDIETGVFDMSPFESGEYWGDSGHERSERIAGRHVVEPWQPAYYEWPIVTVVGVGAGIAAGAIAVLGDTAVLPFGLALSTLLAVSVDIRVADRPIPVTHHIALPAGVAAVALAGNPAVGVLAGAGFGLVGAVFAELLQRVCYAHGDTHFDPAFASILLTSLVLAALGAGGVLDPDSIYYL